LNNKKQLLPFLLLVCLKVMAQQSDTLTWWFPGENSFPVIEGQGWAKKQLKEPYDRLPAYAEEMVRKPVWNLSRNSTGEIIRFKTNAKTFTIQYTVRGRLDLPHFAAMGYSGIDLYSVNKDGEWQWGPATYKFGDTISFKYNITVDDADYKEGREYRLYLPIYNTIKWLKIGYPANSLFTPLAVRTEKPIVVYGTSITQGGCASRAGMTWPSIVGRRLDEPFINLGFSGNGTLDTGMIKLLTDIDAKVYMLDCLANLMNRNDYSIEEVKRRISAAVNYIHNKRPSVPIVMPALGAFNDYRLDKTRGEGIAKINDALKDCYIKLKESGIKNLYILPLKDMHMGLEVTVDGTHATDLGFIQYADANEKLLRKVLNIPAGNIATTEPRIQYRHDDVYSWESQHNMVLQQNKLQPPKVVILGPTGAGNLNKKSPGDMEGNRFCFYGDRIENILWRVEHGELDGFKAKQIILTIGTNNVSINTDTEITKGIQFLLAAINRKQPSAAILVVGLSPGKGQQQRVASLNSKIKKTATALNHCFLEPARLLENDAVDKVKNLLHKNLYSDTQEYLLLTAFLKQSFLKRHEFINE
jgi:hypothetical protein